LRRRIEDPDQDDDFDSGRIDDDHAHRYDKDDRQQSAAGQAVIRGSEFFSLCSITAAELARVALRTTWFGNDQPIAAEPLVSATRRPGCCWQLQFVLARCDRAPGRPDPMDVGLR
jgi:hypothetical protein